MKSKDNYLFCVDIIEGKDKQAGNNNQDNSDLGNIYPNSVLGNIINKNKG